MKLKIVSIISICILLFSSPAFCIDSDGNGIEDSDEAVFIEKFMPCIQLDSDDEDVSPKPVEIIGAHSIDNLYVTVYETTGAKRGTFKNSDCTPPPFSDGTIHLLDSIKYRLSSRPPNLAYYTYDFIPHWEWGSTTSHTPSSWRSTYSSVKDNYNDTVYVTLWEEDTDEICIQYFMFYPYNDWINNHEGDWERICVVVDDEDPEEAEIKRIEYGFHHKMVSITDFSECFLLNETHPVIFAGGEGDHVYWTEPGQGPTGHGCFPIPGTWQEVGAPVAWYQRASEVIENDGSGKFIHYNDLSYVILKTPWNYNFATTDKDMAWFGSYLKFGHLYVTSPGSSIILNCGNTPPKSPLHNWTWHKTGAAAALACPEHTYNHSRPYDTANQSGWGLHVPGHYANLQDALNDAGPGMTVYVDEDMTFTNNITVPEYVTLSVAPNVTLSFANARGIDVEGALVVGSGVTFTKVSGGTYWTGIELESSSQFDVNGDITIEYAQCGIEVHVVSVGNFSNIITIQNCNMCGLCITSGSPLIANINFVDNIGEPYGSIMNATGSVSCPNIYGNTSGDSKYALYNCYNGNVSVNYYDVKNTHTSYPIYVPYPGSVVINGTNNILKAAGVNYAICNGMTGFVDAQNNWWGVANPPSTYFPFPSAQYIDYSNPKSSYFSSAGVYKTVIQEKEPFERAQELEFAGSIDEAIELYESALMGESNPWKKKLIITSMLRAVDHGDKDYDSIRKIVNRELKTADSYYEATLDAILCELLINEGKYQDAITALYEKADKYEDTAIEVEFLSKISMIYGKKLKDKQSALNVANRAKAINPGQDILRAAFKSAGQEYKPWLSTDKFKNETTLTKKSKKTIDTEIVETSSISLSPNPFNPTTTLSYSLANPGHVTLHVYNSTGQKVATLADSYMNAGNHSVVFNGNGLASGMYFYQFSADGVQKSGRMTLVK